MSALAAEHPADRPEQDQRAQGESEQADGVDLGPVDAGCGEKWRVHSRTLTGRTFNTFNRKVC